MPFFKGVCLRQTSGTKTGQPQLVTGWTSVYYCFVGDKETAFNHFDAVNTAEMAMYTGKVSCNVIRISAFNAPKEIDLRGPTATHGGPPLDANIPADPNNALAIKCRTKGPWFNFRYLRGFPTTVVDANIPASFVITQALSDQLATWAQSLIDETIHVRRSQLSDINYQGDVYGTIDVPTINGPVKLMSIRRTGRPFYLRRGRRLVG